MLTTMTVADCRRFVEQSQVCNTTYYRVRRDLFTMFTGALLHARNAEGPMVRLSYEQYLSIRQYLIARNDAIDNNMLLSYERAIIELGALTMQPVPQIGQQ